MAVFNLNPFNTVPLAAATPTQLITLTPGHWNLVLLNVRRRDLRQKRSHGRGRRSS